MNVSFEEIVLNIKSNFTTARESKREVRRTIVKVGTNEYTGIGEAAPSPRYNESSESVIQFISEFKKINLDSESLYDNLEKLNKLNGNYAAKSAIDIALFDLHTKILNIPLWKYFGFSKNTDLYTSYTIGIDTIKNIEKKLDDAENFKILKIKLGCDNDIEIMKAIRRRTDKILRVDINEGWKSIELAIERIKFLEDQNIELIEQPLPADKLYEYNKLREKTTIPIFADESCKNLEDLILIKDHFDGVNIKLSKCGGLFNAYLMLQFAKHMNLKTMLGCMIETSIGISAAAQLAPVVDYIDLDGNLLISNDPFQGVINNNGVLILNNEPGIGVKINNVK